jgi:hypothetical protein
MLSGLPFADCQSLIARLAYETNLSKIEVAAFATEIWPEHPPKSLPNFERSQIVEFTIVKFWAMPAELLLTDCSKQYVLTSNGSGSTETSRTPYDTSIPSEVTAKVCGGFQNVGDQVSHEKCASAPW